MPKQIKSHTYPIAWWMWFCMPKSFEIDTPLPIEEVSDKLFVAFGRGRRFFTPHVIQRTVIDTNTLRINLSVADVTGKYKALIKSRAYLSDFGESTRIFGVIYMPRFNMLFSIPVLYIVTLFYVVVMYGMLSGRLGGEVQSLCTITGIYALVVYGFIIGPIRSYRRMRNDFPEQLQQILADGRKSSKS